MRIVSKFHDYYDSAMGFGIDPNLVYRRETREIVIGRQFVDDWVLQDSGDL